MLDFLLGAAVLVLPRGNLILAAGIGISKGVGELRQRRRAGKAGSNTGGGTGAEDQELLLEPRAPAPAPGGGGHHVPPVVLEWDRLSCSFTPKGKAGGHKTDSSSGTKVILQQLSGCAKPGRLLALMGPSGSGKTSLLNALASHVPANSGMKLTGGLYVNGVVSTDSNHRQAYVEQSDAFYSMLTVQETLSMAAELQLPAPPSSGGVSTTAAADDVVDGLVSVLGLAKSRNTRVGNAKVRGLSGGECKRLAIGCELISSPSLLFLDEPTTGLDAFQAEKVVATLKDLAGAGHTVVASIHQPRSSIYAMFDDLLLLSEGRTCYWGPAEGALPYFAGLGHACPEHYNPAEFVADLISIDFSSPDQEVASRERVKALADAWVSETAQRGGIAATHTHMPRTPSGMAALGRVRQTPSVGWRRQFTLLLRRSWRQITRDRGAAIARLMSNLSSAIIFGAIFFRMKRKQSSIQDRMGLLQVAAINTAMSALVKTLNVFPTERSIVARERGRHAYGVLPYLSGAHTLRQWGGGEKAVPQNWWQSFPFARFLGILTLESFSAAALGLAVGAAAPSTDAALAIGPAVMLVFIVFGGYYKSSSADTTPRALRWLPQSSLIKHGFEGLCINEFEGLTFEADEAGRGMRTGKEVLDWLSFGHTSLPRSLGAQARILAFWYWTTLCLLRAGGPRYQVVEEVEEAAAEPAVSDITTPSQAATA